MAPITTASAPPRAVLVILAVMALLSLRLWERALQQPGIDFFQFWALAKCQRDSGFTLGSPYRERAAYRRQLQGLAVTSGDERVEAVAPFWPALEATGTPLLYYVIGSMPRPYAAALATWRSLEFLSFVTAFFVLVRPLASVPLALGLALAAALAFDPLLLDVQVGNVSSVELLGLVVCVEALRRVRAGTALAGSLPVALVLITLLKPTVGLAAALLGLCLLTKLSWCLRLAAIGSAAVSFAALGLLPVVLFGSAAVWSDWSSYVLSSTDRLAYDIDMGNYSAVTWLAWLTGVEIGRVTALVAVVLAVSAAVTIGPQHAWRAICELFRDPLGVASLGIVALFSLSPLVWSHYQVLAIVPALWLCHASAAAWSRVLGWGSLILFADPARRVLMTWPLPLSIADACHAFSWVPLWIGLLLVLRERARAAGTLSPRSQSPLS